MKNPLLFAPMAIALTIAILPGATADEHYAARNGQTPAGDYSSWASAASNIQDAVNAANTNDRVWVGAGRYTVPTNAVVLVGTNVVYIDKPLTLRSSNGVPATTIIDGAGLYRGVAAWITNTVVTSGLVIDGFTISNCYATNMGGGILFYQLRAAWTGVVQNCVISDNTVAWGTNNWSVINLGAGSYGGAICSYCYADLAGLVVSNSVIRNNRALHLNDVGEYYYGFGGGIWCRSDGEKRISWCRIESNTANTGGGILFTRGSSSTIENNFFIGNRTVVSGYWNVMNTVQGGGVNIQNGPKTVFRNNLFHGNSAYGAGGGILLRVGADILNCTFVSNVVIQSGAGWYGGAAICVGSALPVAVVNSIIYANTTNEVYNFNYGAGYTNLFFTNSCLSSTNAIECYVTGFTNVLGSGNFTSNPAFKDFAGRDFRLKANSPCINAGLNQSWMQGFRDFDNHARIDRFSGRVDVGCYEYLPRGALFKAR